MSLSNQLKDICEHRERNFYRTELQLYPITKILSFLSDAHSQILNNYANYNHWLEADNETKMLLLHSILPKMKYDSRKVFGRYVKKQKKPKTTKLDKQENWVMQVFDVSRKTAKEYLQDEKFLEVVKRKMKP